TRRSSRSERRPGRGGERRVGLGAAHSELLVVLVLFHPPQLKAGLGDRRLDHAAVEIVRRRRIGPDDADRVPGPELLRQLAAALIVRESLQALAGVGFENEDAHVGYPVASLVQNLRPRAAGLAGMGLPLASRRGFLGGALISPSKIAFLRAALRNRRTASLFSRAACSDGFS